MASTGLQQQVLAAFAHQVSAREACTLQAVLGAAPGRPLALAPDYQVCLKLPPAALLQLGWQAVWQRNTRSKVAELGHAVWGPR